MDNTERLRLLFESGHWSEEDRRWLLEYLDTQDEEALRRLMEAHFQADATAAAPEHHPQAERLLTLIHEKIQHPTSAAAPLHQNAAPLHQNAAPLHQNATPLHQNATPTQPSAAPIQPSAKPRFFSLLERHWQKLAVAALVLLIAGKVVLYLSHSPKTPPLPPNPPAIAHDQPPGRNNAVLTLADGRTITLDSAANGGLAQQGATRVIKLNGQIAYKNTGNMQAGDASLFNTITTARGNQYQLILSDGSKCWLNAASSIRFPTAFTGKERRVEITGEAYFEIAKNAAMPFKITAGGGEIDVLGTSFNINAYGDEPAVKTTVVEGAVAVKRETNRQVLGPGQQAAFGAQGGITLAKNVDVARATAWKNGFFWFDNTDIYTLMRQVSRWYDVEVTFKGNIEDDGFTGKIPRNLPLSKFLNVLEQYELHFTIEGKKIIVQP